MEVDSEGEQDIHGTEAERLAVLEEVDPGGRPLARVGSNHGEMQPRRGSRRLGPRTRLPVPRGRQHQCSRRYRSQA